MVMATAKRHKYRFSSRIEAEDQYVRADKERTEQARALNAIFRDEVYYLPRVGPYLVGLFWLEKANGHVLIRQPRSDASVIVMDVDDALEWIDRDNGAGSFDADLRRIAYWVRMVRARVWKGEAIRAVITDVCSNS